MPGRLIVFFGRYSAGRKFLGAGLWPVFFSADFRRIPAKMTDIRAQSPLTPCIQIQCSTGSSAKPSCLAQFGSGTHYQLKSVICLLNTCSDVNKATTFKANAKATYLKAKNTLTFPQHLYQTINVLRSNLQSSLKIGQCSISIVIRLK